MLQWVKEEKVILSMCAYACTLYMQYLLSVCARVHAHTQGIMLHVCKDTASIRSYWPMCCDCPSNPNNLHNPFSWYAVKKHTCKCMLYRNSAVQLYKIKGERWFGANGVPTLYLMTTFDLLFLDFNPHFVSQIFGTSFC